MSLKDDILSGLRKVMSKAVDDSDLQHGQAVTLTKPDGSDVDAVYDAETYNKPAITIPGDDTMLYVDDIFEDADLTPQTEADPDYDHQATVHDGAEFDPQPIDDEDDPINETESADTTGFEGEETTDLGGQSVDELLGNTDAAESDDSESEADDTQSDEEADSGEAEAPDDPESGGGQTEDGGEGSNPWVQYRGNAGGEGWQNIITGEIRYQEGRPAPTEAEAEQMANAESAVDGSDAGLAIGDPVTFAAGPDNPDETGTITEQIDEYTVMVETDDGQTYGVPIEDVSPDPSAAAQQEPDAGFADGWQAPPDDWTTVDKGDYVEVYRQDTGEWVVGQKKQGGMGDYMMVVFDDGMEAELLAGSDTGYVLTAVEDTIDGVPMDEDAIEGLEVGDTVLWDSPGVDGLLETDVVDTGGWGKTEIQVEDYDGDWVTVQNPEETLFGDPPEWEDWPFGDDAEMVAQFDGEYVKYDHPSRGIVAGVLTVQEDADGDYWFHIEDDDNGDGDNCSGWTSKAGHPLSSENVDMVEMDDPFDDWKPSDLKSLKPGDKIVVDGEVETVELVDMDGIIQIEGSNEMVVEDLSMAEQYDAVVPDKAWIPSVEAPEPPDVMDDGWKEPLSIEDADSPDYYNEGDMVWYEDDDHNAVTAEVADTDQYGDIVTVDGETIPMNSVQGYANLGAMNDVGEHQVDFDDIFEGDAITYRRENYNGDIEQYTAVIDTLKAGGKAEVTVMEGGSGSYTIDPSDDNIAIIDHSPDFDPMDLVENNGMEMEADVIVDSMLADAGISLDQNGSSLTKASFLWKWFGGKSQQKDLKSRFNKYFPKSSVDRFYNDIEYRKKSGNHAEEERNEWAFKKAFDLKSRVRRDGEPDQMWKPPESDEEMSDMLAHQIKMAEVIGVMSKRFHELNLQGERVTRGCVKASFRDLMHQYLEDPTMDEFNISGRATNNFAPVNTSSWNYWDIRKDEVGSEHVMMATDFLFNPMGTHSTEKEYWLTADGLTAHKHEVGIGPDRKTDIDGVIEEWSPSKARTIAKVMGDNWESMLGKDGEIEHPEKFSDNQLSTLLRMSNKFKEVGADTEEGVSKMLTDIKTWAEEEGVETPGSSSSSPDGSVGAVQDPENWDYVEQGTPIEFHDSLTGQDREGYFHSFYEGDDTVVVWNKDPAEVSGTDFVEYEVDPTEITTVDGETDIDIPETATGHQWETGGDVLAYDAVMDEEMVLTFDGYQDGQPMFSDPDGGKYFPESDDDLSIIDDDYELPDAGETVTITDTGDTAVVDAVLTVGEVPYGVEVQTGSGDYEFYELSEVEASDGPDEVVDPENIISGTQVVVDTGAGNIAATVDGNTTSSTGPTVTDQNGENYQVTWDEIQDVKDPYTPEEVYDEVEDEGETYLMDGPDGVMSVKVWAMPTGYQEPIELKTTDSPPEYYYLDPDGTLEQL